MFVPKDSKLVIEALHGTIGSGQHKLYKAILIFPVASGFLTLVEYMILCVSVSAAINPLYTDGHYILQLINV